MDAKIKQGFLSIPQSGRYPILQTLVPAPNIHYHKALPKTQVNAYLAETTYRGQKGTGTAVKAPKLIMAKLIDSNGPMLQSTFQFPSILKLHH